MGIEFDDAGTATYRRAETRDPDALPVARATARWRIIDNVLVFKAANQAGQDECALVGTTEGVATLSCQSIGGIDDGTTYEWYLSLANLRVNLPGTWVSDEATITFHNDGSYTAEANEETLTGVWSLNGLRLTVGGLARCDYAGELSADDLLQTCQFSGESREYLTLWQR